MAYDYSSLFSSLGTTSSSSSAFSLDYTTLASIKNGSYKKLLNAYYDKQNTDSSSSTSSTSSDKKTTSTQKINAASVRDDADAVTDAVTALNKTSLWSKVEKTDESGNKTKEYDTDAIYKAVKSYVDNYNSLVGDTGNSTDNSVLRNATTMVGTTKANKDLLAQVGISIGTDNKLTIDEKAFKSSEMSTVKSLFTGSGSYGKSVQSESAMMYSSAVTQLAKISGSNTYSSTGAYQYISGSDISKYL